MIFFKIIFLTTANIDEVSHGYLVNEEENKENTNENNSVNEEYKDLKNENAQKDKKLRELENTYTEKISELLILIQIHCEIKTEMYMKMEDAGVIKDNNKI